MNISYHEFNPAPVLQPYVDCYWSRVFHAGIHEVSPLQRCLPLGTMEIIFHINESHCEAFLDGKWQLLPCAFVVGIYKEPVLWKTQGPSRVFGIRLKPESLIQLFRIPPAAVFNTFTEIENFFGTEIRALTDRIMGVQDTGTLISIIESFFRSRLCDIHDARSYLFEATRLIRQSGGALSVDELSENLFISKRQLQRTFKDHFGTSPKTYQRIIRFRNAYQYVQQFTGTPRWIDITYNFGYADQAHFIRDFKQFTGEVPTFLREGEEQFYQLTGSSC